MRAPGTAARAPEASTSSTAAMKSPQVAMSSTEANTPAMDDAPPSSLVDDERTTRGRSPAPSRSQAVRAGLGRSWREGCDQPR
jgi:hypothetical protein